jgi:hypothetical protein
MTKSADKSISSAQIVHTGHGRKLGDVFVDRPASISPF